MDVAIGLAAFRGSTAPAKHVASIPRVVVASAHELARHGAPETPDDRVRHRVVDGTAAAVPTALRFERDGQVSAIKFESHFSIDRGRLLSRASFIA